MALSPKKELAARLLSQGYRQAEIARDERIHVTKQTMNNWTKEPEFRQAIEEYKTNKLKQVDSIFFKSASDCAETVVEIATSKPLDDEGNPIDYRFITSKLKAALWILDKTMGKTPKLPAAKEEIPEDEPEDDEMDSILENVKR